MTQPNLKRCAIYTRKSTEEGLDQEFNSLHAQREACEAYIVSQKHEGWEMLPTAYDDGGFSGGDMKRPALKQLMDDIESGRIDIVVVYKVDRLTRSLADFAKLVELMDQKQVSFVSVTQQFNTTTSMGRLTLNVLLSFAQFEREVTGERIRDKIALSKQKGKWMGGVVPLGYDSMNGKLRINETEAASVQFIFERYRTLRSVKLLQYELSERGIHTKRYVSRKDKITGGRPFERYALYRILQSRLYLGEITHKDKIYPGEHDAIIPRELFDEVQQILGENRVREKGAMNAQSGSLLSGKLFDDKGHYMTPKHSRTRKRHYRYYTSQALIKGKWHLAGSLPNIPAHEIEALVKTSVYDLVRDSACLLPYLETSDVVEQQQLLQMTASLSFNSTADEALFTRALVSKVKLSSDEIIITLCANSLCEALLTLHRGGNIAIEAALETETPIILRKRTQLAQVQNGSKVIAGAAKSRANTTLVKAVSRSFLWHEQMLSGEFKTLVELREAAGIKDKAYIEKIMRLRFLAPDIIERILSGTHLAHWTLQKLQSVKSFDWQEQRCQLGLI